MKKLLLSLILMSVCFTAANAQKYFTKNGNISFYSKAPLEDIEAHNKKVTSVIDFETGQVEFAVLMKAFEFEKALMQEHFNENYVESHKFPRATFKGNITDFKNVNLTQNGTYPVNVAGQLTIKGETKNVNAPGTVTVNGDKILVNSEFKVLLEDYKITIPAVVKDNIAREITIVVNSDYEVLNK